MKRTFLCILALLALTLAAPFLALLPFFSGGGTGSPAPAESAAPGTQPAASAAPQTIEQDPLLLWDTASSTLLTVPVQDYLIAAAACEMPIAWPEEAIKAQMVACHSWALYQKALADGSNEGAYFTVNSAQCSGYATEQVLRSRWGTQYDANYAKLKELAQQVQYDLVLYNGKPAAAAYHSISCGKTEASQNVWVDTLPYLQGVDSSWDHYAEDYEVTIQYSRQQMHDALVMNLNLTPGDDPAAWFGDPTWDNAGYVSSIPVCGEDHPGTEVRAALNLRSACFAITYADDLFTITTRGFGHGVGMSQYGALAMAQGGTGWQKILAYYFPGTTFGKG